MPIKRIVEDGAVAAYGYGRVVRTGNRPRSFDHAGKYRSFRTRDLRPDVQRGGATPGHGRAERAAGKRAEFDRRDRARSADAADVPDAARCRVDLPCAWRPGRSFIPAGIRLRGY